MRIQRGAPGKWQLQNQPNNNVIYTYTYSPINKVKNSPTKIEYSRLTQQTKEIKKYIYQLRTKLTKAQAGKQN